MDFTLGKAMTSTWKIAFVGAILIAGCTTPVRYEYFEPSGMGATISSPEEAPKNVAQKRFASGELSVWSNVTEHGTIEVLLRAEVAAGHTLSFRNEEAVIISGDKKAVVGPLVWSQWRIVDGRGEFADVPFEAPLTSRTVDGSPPRTGTQILGRYDCTVKLPEQFSSVQDFSVELPAPSGEESPLHLTFIRKVADYRMHVQLQ
ncbi:hypothetical protein [Pelagicoccus sp. SDUM812003]|uniref:hypothetical protein n=1 Tax=Pelagicoccus sp. SDUM812003 TaxID=3041267 RepID=UPI00280C735F|nr:hypothetical protein [Pelagicoccus sp. SDUM812003]MDQ8205782.1 hypothetical protein [Pelagicoccus sp. SDUM812003]